LLWLFDQSDLFLSLGFDRFSHRLALDRLARFGASARRLCCHTSPTGDERHRFDLRHPLASYHLPPVLRSTSFAAVSQPLPSSADVDASPEAFVCPLSQVPPGTVCRVNQLLASPDICSRLREMGFCEQQQIRLLTQERTMICQVCNARLGISARLADAILVEPIPAGARAA